MSSSTPGKIIRAGLIPALAFLLVVSGAAAASLPQDGPPEKSDEKSAEPKPKDEPKPAEKPAEIARAADAADAEEKTDDEPLRFTNDDLPRTPPMYRSGPEADEKDNAATRGDKGRRGQKANDKKSDKRDVPASAEVDEQALQAQRRALEKRTVELSERVAYLESRLFALRNPLYRGKTPSRDDEEAAVGGLSNVARVEWVTQQIDAAKSELQNTRAELLTLSRR